MLNHRPDETVLTMSFRSTFAEIRQVLQILMAQDAVERLGSRARHDLELVLAEALNNVAEHAYNEDVPGLVALTLTVGRARVVTVVRDFGRPFPDFAKANGSPLDAESEGGRGLLLIRSLCEDVDYRRVGNENILTLEMVSSG